eukprot:14463241-Alexandrium_andersonii.AAC.1
MRKHTDTEEEARAHARTSRQIDRQADKRHRQTERYVQAEAQNKDKCTHRNSKAHADAQILSLIHI